MVVESSYSQQERNISLSDKVLLRLNTIDAQKIKTIDAQKIKTQDNLQLKN